jgi:hypothetical protein
MTGRRTLDQSNPRFSLAKNVPTDIKGAEEFMSNEKKGLGAVYDALRSDLINLLMEHRSQGRFTQVAEGTDQARSVFLTDLTRSIAGILVTAYPKKDSNTYATALADARTIANAVLDRGLLTS